MQRRERQLSCTAKDARALVSEAEPSITERTCDALLTGSETRYARAALSVPERVVAHFTGSREYPSSIAAR